MPSYSSSRSGELFKRPAPNAPANHLVAHTDGGARGNPGPSGYGVVIQDQGGQSIATLSEYLGHQTNNFAEYQALIAALEYAVGHGHKALKVVSDSELMVRQIKGVYKVKNAALQDLHARAKELIDKLDWFYIEHVLRGKNAEADRLANEAMDGGTRGRVLTLATESRQSAIAQGAAEPKALRGIYRNGVVELLEGAFPEGTWVEVRAKK